MNDRDLIIERLERKIAEKEKEIRELKRVASMNLEEIKSEILAEIKAELEKLKEIEGKVLELKKTVESLMDEILYIKGELHSRRENPREIKEIVTDEFDVSEEEKGKRDDSEDEIIVVD